MPAPTMTRRRAIAGGAASAAAGLFGLLPSGAEAAGPRVAALDWGLASTVAALGAGPAAVAERDGYARWVGAPTLPAATIELGLRTGPSLETLAALKPDLILVNALNAGLRARLDTIAPTYSNTIFGVEHAPIAGAIAAARALGQRLDRSQAAEALIAATEAHFTAARLRLAARAPRPLIPLGFLDSRHVRLYGAGSLFDDVMGRIGLRNGWTGATNPWGFSLVAIEALATCPDVDLLVIDPTPADARHAMAHNGLWSALVAANRMHVIALPPIWAFGDLCAAGRCADLMAEALAPNASREPGVDGRRAT